VKVFKPVQDRLDQLRSCTIQNGGHGADYPRFDDMDTDNPELPMPALPNMCVMEAIAWIMGNEQYTNGVHWITDDPVCVAPGLTQSMIGVNDRFEMDTGFCIDGQDQFLSDYGDLMDELRTQLLTPLIPLIIGTALVIEKTSPEGPGYLLVKAPEQQFTPQELDLLMQINEAMEEFRLDDVNYTRDEGGYNTDRIEYDTLDDARAAIRTYVQEHGTIFADLVTQFCALRKPHVAAIVERADPVYGYVLFAPDTEQQAAATGELLSDFMAAFVTEKETVKV